LHGNQCVPAGAGCHLLHRGPIIGITQQDDLRIGFDQLLLAELPPFAGHGIAQVEPACHANQPADEGVGSHRPGLGGVGAIQFIEYHRGITENHDFLFHRLDACLQRCHQVGGFLLPACQFTHNCNVGIQTFHVCRVGECIDGYAQVLQRLHLLGRVGGGCQHQVGLQAGDGFQVKITHRAAHGGQGFGFFRVIGKFIPSHHLRTRADGKQDFGVGWCQRDDSRRGAGEGDGASPPIGKGFPGRCRRGGCAGCQQQREGHNHKENAFHQWVPVIL